ncbi:hypothetical protein Agub_g12961 [Astrephomene gubernaculifera]|uniref:Uncharacterized protein n=1 Tax=Astrephomene gubernaculifera TaxID=47775 RepID=A0AAD3HR29_9CHLO|nr:hypothetical protein Agub_g12961 [Astrephomene gubernaculifera]
MASDYSLELWDVRGLPSSYNRLVLEVIVRTPRLLSTVRRKHSTSGFQADAARGVTISWSQAKAAKASVRLRVVPGDTAAAAESVTTAAAPSAVSEGLLKACKSREVPLLLGAQGLQAAQLQLQLQTDPGGSGGAAAAAGGRGGGGRADTGCLVAEVEFVVRSKADGGDGNPVAAAAAAPASAAMPAAANNAASNPSSTSTGAGGDSAAAGGSPLATLRSSSLHAWSGQAAAAAQPEPAPSAAGTAAATAAPTARKRSWLLALGLVRHAGGGGAGSAEHANDAGGGNCALANFITSGHAAAA